MSNVRFTIFELAERTLCARTQIRMHRFCAQANLLMGSYKTTTTTLHFKRIHSVKSCIQVCFTPLRSYNFHFIFAFSTIWFRITVFDYFGHKCANVCVRSSICVCVCLSRFNWVISDRFHTAHTFIQLEADIASKSIENDYFWEEKKNAVITYTQFETRARH